MPRKKMFPRKRRGDALSDQLRTAIDASGLTRYAICQKIGLNESTMSRFMAGKSGLSLVVIDELGKLLRLRVVVDEAKKG